MTKNENKTVIIIIIIAGIIYLSIKYYLPAIIFYLIAIAISIYLYFTNMRFKNWIRVKILKKKPITQKTLTNEIRNDSYKDSDTAELVQLLFDRKNNDKDGIIRELKKRGVLNTKGENDGDRDNQITQQANHCKGNSWIIQSASWNHSSMV